MKAFLSKLGQTFMLPIALLPAAGIMLGIGGSFTNLNMIYGYNLTFLGNVSQQVAQDGNITYVLESSTILYNILHVITSAGQIVFDNLPLMFAMAIAIGFAKKEKGAAALAAVMGYLIMTVSAATFMGSLNMITDSGNLLLFGHEIPGMIKENMLGVSNALEMGVFGGIISGSVTALLHNRFIDAKVPDFLGFFGGPRLVPILASFAALIYGILLVFIWPFFGIIFNSMGNGLGVLVDNGLGFIASLLFGIIERALIPFGLHHVFYLPLWQTAVGGTAVIDGNTVLGTQNIFFEALATGNLDADYLTSTNFMTGKFPFMLFGLPAASYAMYSVADEDKKKQVAGLYFSIALTSFLTGITEPIEFTFLFLAPKLYYGFHVPMAGISFMLMDLLNVRVGMTFSGGAIDFTLFGILPGVTGTDNHWYLIPVVGIFYAFIYYFVFKWYILKYDLATPGRNGAELKAMSKKEYRELKGKNTENNDLFIQEIINGLGGKDNIKDVDACITRLRVTVKDNTMVKDNEYWVNQLNAKGIMINGNAIQVIYGSQAAVYKPLIEEQLGY